MARSLSTYTAGRGGSFEVCDEPAEAETARIAAGTAGSTVLYPDSFFDWDDASEKLSVDLATTVFSFHIHDGDLWMFVAFDRGAEVVKFNPEPDYWEELTSQERAAWLPMSEEVAALVPNVQPSRLSPYLRHWPEDGIDGKAHPEDDFGFEDWQLVDFVRELGFVLPEPGNSSSYRMTLE